VTRRAQLRARLGTPARRRRTAYATLEPWRRCGTKDGCAETSLSRRELAPPTQVPAASHYPKSARSPHFDVFYCSTRYLLVTNGRGCICENRVCNGFLQFHPFSMRLNPTWPSTSLSFRSRAREPKHEYSCPCPFRSQVESVLWFPRQACLTCNAHAGGGPEPVRRGADGVWLSHVKNCVA
jgi:hypothetical protein